MHCSMRGPQILRIQSTPYIMNCSLFQLNKLRRVCTTVSIRLPPDGDRYFRSEPPWPGPRSPSLSTRSRREFPCRCRGPRGLKGRDPRRQVRPDSRRHNRDPWYCSVTRWLKENREYPATMRLRWCKWIIEIFVFLTEFSIFIKFAEKILSCCVQIGSFFFIQVFEWYML